MLLLLRVAAVEFLLGLRVTTAVAELWLWLIDDVAIAAVVEAVVVAIPPPVEPRFL